MLQLGLKPLQLLLLVMRAQKCDLHKHGKGQQQGTEQRDEDLKATQAKLTGRDKVSFRSIESQNSLC